jgi:hypothetical protein
MSQKPAQSAAKGRTDPSPFPFQQGDDGQAAPAPAPRPSRPHLLDYFLLLLGFGLSILLARLSPLPVEALETVADPRLRSAVSYLPDLMRLPEGVILLGPLLFALQFLVGRRQGLTSIGWLWAFSWLGVLVLTGLLAWRHFFPESAPPVIARAPWLWYMILAPSMAALAVVLGLLSLFSRRPAPWTHTFGVALLVWPVPPLVVILALAKL